MNEEAGKQRRLRKLAEQAMAARQSVAHSPSEAMLHELHVYQIELEMKNEELRSARTALEASATATWTFMSFPR